MISIIKRLFFAVLVLGHVFFFFHGFLCRLRLPLSSLSRIVLLADPQMEGDAREHREGTWGLVNNHLNDIYHWHIFNSAAVCSPDKAVVLGDVFSYQFLSDEEFSRRVGRFRRISSLLERRVGPSSLHILAGNHDIGYARELELSNVDRWEAAFGPIDAEFEAAGHVFYIVNGLSLDSESAMDAPGQPIRNRTLARLHANINARKEFYFNDAKDGQSNDHQQKQREEDHHQNDPSNEPRASKPAVLLTHIPLHKAGHNCSGDRAETDLDWAGRVSSQTMLSPETSSLLLDGFRPVFVFSGHDHEGCQHHHNNRTFEVTVRSMLGDYGGHFEVLDIIKGEGGFSYKITPCPYLPMKLFVGFIVADAVLAFLAFLVWLWGRCTRPSKQKRA